MAGTYTHTTTHTFTQTDVVVMQYEIALMYADVLDDVRTKAVLKAIRDKKITSMGIYAKKNDKRVAEVEIIVDWKKHEQIVRATGDKFDYHGGGFNFKTGEAAETKVYVNKLVELANMNHFDLSMWVLVSDNIRKDEAQYSQLLKDIGFVRKGPADWGGNIKINNYEDYGAIPQMRIGIKATDI